MTTLTAKLQRLAALRPLSPESVAGRAAAWDVRMVYESNNIPPNPVKVPELMEELCGNLANLPDPVERAAALHYGIARIQPFADGNGRSARLAMNFILIAAGYPPVSISPNLRTAYYAALEAADAGEQTAFLTFFFARLNQELDTWLEALEETQDARRKAQDFKSQNKNLLTRVISRMLIVNSSSLAP